MCLNIDISFCVCHLASSSIFCYNNVMISLILQKAKIAVAILFVLAIPTLVSAQVSTGVPLAQPLDDKTKVIPSSPNIFIDYFNMSSSWLFRVAIGFTVLWVLIGGVMFMSSGNNQSRRQEAISRITWSIVGLLVLLFTGVILRTLNSIFFV